MNGILGSTTLDVVVGLVFVYLLLAIICTSVNEWIAGVMKVRSNNMASAIEQLLDAQPGGKDGAANWFLQQFYSHPLIAGMRRQNAKQARPSYLSARTFATAVMDIATPQKPGVITFTDLEVGIRALPGGDVRKTLLALILNSQNDLAKAQKNIEDWFDDTMARVSGWYKRTTQIWTVAIALLLTVASNADTMRITSTLWKNPTLRAQVVESAKNRTEAPESSVSVEYKDKNNPLKPTAKVTKEELGILSQLLGWTNAPLKPGDWPQRILGWFLTIVAVSLGAPFWFDVLNKVMNIRSAGRPPDEAAKAAPATTTATAK